MDAVVAVVVANAVLATVAAALVAGVCGLVRRPAVANRAWLLVLLKLVTPPALGLSVAWLVTPAPTPVVAPPPSAPAALPEVDDAPPDLLDLPAVAEPVVEPLPAPPTVAETAPEQPAPPPAPDWSWARPTLLAAWAGGAVGWWAVVVTRVSRFRRVLRIAGSASPELTAAVAVVASRFGLRAPTAVLVDAPVSPLVWAGFGRPVLVFPARLWEALSADQRDAVLAHELAHLARRDHWVRRLEVVVLGVYWWLPTAWLAVRELRKAEEACCDAWAVGGDPARAAGYANALVEAVAVLSGRSSVPLASGGAAGLGELNRRVTMILTNRPAPRLSRLARLLVLAAAVGLLPWGVTLADDPLKPVPPSPGGDASGGENRATVTLRLTAQQADYEAEVKAAEAAFTVARENLAHTEQLVKKGFAASEHARIAKLELDAAAARLEATKARQRAGRAGPGRGGAPVSFTAPAEEVERLKEEIELLAVQMDIKRAGVMQAETAIKLAARKFNSAREMVAKGMAPQGAAEGAQAELESAETQLVIRKAELREHELRLTHAKRRLDRLASPRSVTPPPASPPPAGARRAVGFGEVAGGVSKSIAVRFPNPLPRPVRPTAKVPDDVRGFVEVQFPTPSVDAGQEGTAVVVVRGNGTSAAHRITVPVVDGTDTLAVLDLAVALTPAQPRPNPSADQTALFTLRRELVASQQRAETMAKQIADLTAAVQQMRKERDHLTALIERLEKQLQEKK